MIKSFRRNAFACEHLERRRLLAAGDLDPSFGGDGEANYSSAAYTFEASDVAVQADGKTVVVGTVVPHKGFAVTRYLLNGTPDPSFGPNHNGTVVTLFGDSAAHGVAIQPDGRIVVVGEADGSETRVVRYTPEGALDRSFDGDGIVGFSGGGLFDYITYRHVLIQPDGKVLLGGSGVTGIIDSNQDFAFARLDPDGSFDDDFGDGGERILGFGNNEFLAGIALDFSGTPATNPDYGKIIAAGTRSNADGTSSAILVTRLTKDGDWDRTYDGDGSGLFDVVGWELTQASGVAVQDDGRIVVGGTNANPYFFDRADFLLVRFEHGGPLDTTFGGAGKGYVSANFGGRDEARDVIVAPSGALVLAGMSTVGVSPSFTKRDALAYFTPDGVPDARFGRDGKRLFPFFGDWKLANGPGRRFVFAGGAGMHAARFFDLGANLVFAATLNSVASETGPTTRGFFVYRLERLPVATRVYFDVGGTATSPSLIFPRNRDYTSEGMVFPFALPGESDTPFVDIPADATFATVLITPVDDTRVEGNETAVFTIRPDAAYDVGDPRTVTLTIVDNDAPPPSVAEVYARGSAWLGTDGDDLNVTFKEYLAANALGDAEFGYRVDNLPAGSTLPWNNVDQLVLRYTAPPTGAAVPTAAGVILDGVRSDYAVTSVAQLDPQTYLLTLDRALGTPPGGSPGNDGDRVTLSVPGGAAGRTFTLPLATLQGDADRAGGRVNALDVAFVKSRLNRTATQPPPTSGAAYSPFADVNADGRVNALDLAAVKSRLNKALPGAAAPALLTAISGIAPGRRAAAHPGPG